MTTETKTPEAPSVKPIDFLGRYRELAAYRDKVNAANAPLEAELAKANEAAEKARLEANAISAKIDANRGGPENWLAVKREIRMLAQALGKIPHESPKE